MTAKEAIDAMMLFPPFFKDVGIVVILLSVIEISPLKLNPWKWVKAFIALPARLDKLERDVNNDRAYKWRSMILSRADHIRAGDKMSKEKWDDTIETIDRYEEYCEEMEKEPDCGHFANGKAKVAIHYLKKKHEYVYENNDYLPDYDEEEELIS